MLAFLSVINSYGNIGIRKRIDVYKRQKEFYTITTADESVFYLVIDKQKTSENVYFLNSVTTDDLLPLAEQGKEPPKEVTPEPEPKPTEPVEEVPEPEPEKKDSPLLSLLLIGAVVLAGEMCIRDRAAGGAFGNGCGNDHHPPYPDRRSGRRRKIHQSQSLRH